LTACTQIAIVERQRSLTRYSVRDTPMVFQNSRIILEGLVLLNLSMLITCVVMLAFGVFRHIKNVRKMHRIEYDVEELKVIRERDRKPVGAFFIDLFFELMTIVVGFGILTVICFLSQELFDKDIDEFARLCTDSECDIIGSYYWSKIFQEVIILAFPLFSFGIEVLSIIGKIFKYSMENGACPKCLSKTDYKLRTPEKPAEVISTHYLI
jgi:hypothetical protein